MRSFNDLNLFYKWPIKSPISTEIDPYLYYSGHIRFAEGPEWSILTNKIDTTCLDNFINPMPIKLDLILMASKNQDQPEL